MALRSKPMLYAYQPQPLPGPGTGNYSFLPLTTLPMFQVQGAGIVYSKSMNAFQGEQVYYVQQQQIQGYAGVFANSIYMSSLFVPPNSSGSV